MGKAGGKAKIRPEPIDPGDARRVKLRFAKPKDADRDPRANLSAVAAAGSTIFVADDEEAGIRSFAWKGAKGRFEEVAFTSLGEIFELPEIEGGEPGEMDIEGLDVAGDALWIVGSHSLGRKKPEEGDTDKGTIERLAKIKHAANRHFLGRVPLAARADGSPKLAKKGAACLEMGERSGRLFSLLAADDHLARFIGIPAKENGFDIEGLAVLGKRRDRLFLGLRGPVLRGWAILVELRVIQSADGRLDLAEIDGWRRYRKHFLDLGGLGIRELLADPLAPDDLLILAGPTMDLDGPVHLFRWPDGANHDAAQMVAFDELSVPMQIPCGRGCDHAEGVCLLPEAAGGQGREILILHDSPDEQKRFRDPWKLLADVLPLPRPSK